MKIQSDLRLLTRVILAVQTMMFIFLSLGGMLANHWLKGEVARGVALQARRSLILGDQRQAILALDHGGRDWFTRIDYLQEGRTLFRAVSGSEPGFFDGTVRIPIYLDNGGTEVAGVLAFHYSRTGALGVALIAWTIAMMLSLYILQFFRGRIIQRHEDEMSLRHQAGMVEIARQVAHDIRSPLAALNVISTQLAGFSDDQKHLIRTAVGRIRDIASHLLESERKIGEFSTEEKGCSVHLVPVLMEDLVSEKRIQYRSRSEVEIEAQPSAEWYGLFARVHAVEFGRVMSNLIDNAVQSIERSGRVRITLEGDDDRIEVKIRDDGKGIPAEILHRLTLEQLTYGKEKGSGLGLVHARRSIESWSGSLRFESRMGEGTTVTLVLPRSESPEWFLSKLTLPAEWPVIVLDDDLSIHRVWERRLEPIQRAQDGHGLVCLASVEELTQWVSEHAEVSRGAMFLLDFELPGGISGLDLIQSLGIADRSVLVTSHFEDEKIRAHCRELGVRIIPKGMAGFVPLVESAKVRMSL